MTKIRVAEKTRVMAMLRNTQFDLMKTAINTEYEPNPLNSKTAVPPEQSRRDDEMADDEKDDNNDEDEIDASDCDY
jgi:hypothetical protein